MLLGVSGSWSVEIEDQFKKLPGGKGIYLDIKIESGAADGDPGRLKKIVVVGIFGDPMETLWKNCIFGLCGVKAFQRKNYGVIVEYRIINSNGRAPNYASSSLGNIRYESLVYAYAKIINFYRVNDRLPDYVIMSNIVGADAVGVVIDTVAPSITNNLAPGGKIKDGVIELRAGNYVKGMKDIALGTFGFDIWGSVLASYLVDQALPT